MTQTESKSNVLANKFPRIPAFIFDLDGVLANNTWRQHILKRSGDTKPSSLDWQDFFSASEGDGIYEDTLRLLKALQASGYAILLVTGRSEDYETLTTNWLSSYGIVPDRLFQRRHKDFRKDFEIKREIFLSYIDPFYSVLGVFEDRDDCVKMWRDLSLTCYQPRVAVY